jgi:hypothetical protein
MLVINAFLCKPKKYVMGSAQVGLLVPRCQVMRRVAKSFRSAHRRQRLRIAPTSICFFQFHKNCHTNVENDLR